MWDTVRVCPHWDSHLGPGPSPQGTCTGAVLRATGPGAGSPAVAAAERPRYFWFPNLSCNSSHPAELNCPCRRSSLTWVRWFCFSQSANPGERKRWRRLRCSPYGNGGAAPIRGGGWVRSWWQDLSKQGEQKEAPLLLPSSMGAAPGPGAPGRLEPLGWQVLARANAAVRPGGQVLLCLEKWLRLASHAAPLLSCASELHRPTVTAAPSRDGLGSLVGQLVRLLPQLWLLFEEVTNYWHGRSHGHLKIHVKKRGHWYTFK